MAELLASISADELRDWAAYYQLDPFGARRGDLQAALVASTLANIHAKKGYRFTLADFVLNFDEVPRGTETMSPSEIHARVSTMLAARGMGHGQ